MLDSVCANAGMQSNIKLGDKTLRQQFCIVQTSFKTHASNNNSYAAQNKNVQHIYKQQNTPQLFE